MSTKKKLVALTHSLLLSNIHSFALLTSTIVQSVTQHTWDAECCRKIMIKANELAVASDLETCADLLKYISDHVPTMLKDVDQNTFIYNRALIVRAQCEDLIDLIVEVLTSGLFDLNKD